MKVYIAEKPSLGIEVANALGGGAKRNGYIEGNGWIMTWVFGHVYGLLMPQEYDEKYKFWSINNLPILPEQMKLKPSKDATAQINIIKKLLNESDSAVNCGDADREGQLLVDEVFQVLNYKKPISRIWINDMTKTGIQKSIKNEFSNNDKKGLSDAGACRRDSDWLVGFNFTQLVTLSLRSTNNKASGTQNIGRVMTPTLKIVVDRDRAIENFKPMDFYEVYADYDLGFSGKWNTPEEELNAEGYLVNKSVADKVSLACQKTSSGKVLSADYKKQSSAAPMPFTLPEFQKTCNSKFGWTAKKSLSILQSLYETHKMTSYPRTEVPYLSMEQKAAALDVLNNSLVLLGRLDLMSGADFKRSHPVFNDKKLGEHHAIIPTGQSERGVSALSGDERSAYELVVKRYLAVFYPPKITEIGNISIDIDGFEFNSTPLAVLDFGWEQLMSDGSLENQNPLSKLSVGDTVGIDGVRSVSKKTSPPPRFNESSLISMMESAGRLLESNEDKEILKETSGIGTGATRGDIIDKLASSKVGFLVRKGKQILSTEKGRLNIDSAINEITSPALTAEWEKRMKLVECGELSRAEYMNGIKTWISEVVEKQKSTVDFISEPAGGRPPTSKQISYAEKLAKENGVILSQEEKESGYKCSQFIDKYKKEYDKSAPRPPTEKQLAFAEKLAKEKGKKIPAKAKKDLKECSTFIDLCLKGKK